MAPDLFTYGNETDGLLLHLLPPGEYLEEHASRGIHRTGATRRTLTGISDGALDGQQP